MGYPFEPNQLPVEFDLTDLDVTPPDIDYPFHEKVTEYNDAPAVGGAITVPVDDSARYAVGVPLYFAGIGIFRVSALASATSITIENATAAEGAPINIGVPFCTCALPEEREAVENLVYDVLSTGFTVPAVGASASIAVSRGGWFVTGGVIYVADAGWFRVTDPAVGGGNKVCKATKLFEDGSAPGGNTISAGARVHAVAEIPYAPDNNSILHSNSTGVPGAGTIAVAGKYPTTPDATEVKILTGSIAPATYNNDGELSEVTFPSAFSSVPAVMLSIVTPSMGAGNVGLRLHAVSETAFTPDLYSSASTGEDATIYWTAIGV